MSNRAPTALPPLPEPFAWMKRLTEHFDGEWDAYDFSVNQFGDFTSPLYTTEQVKAIRRETVEACAALCDKAKKGVGSLDLADAIRALLPVKEPKE